MTKTKVLGSVEGGKLLFSNAVRRRMQEDLRQFPDCDVDVIIKKRGKRSDPQNRYYWGVLIKEATNRMKDLGNWFTEDQVHEAFKARFNPVHCVDAHGELLEGFFGGSTTEMNKAEFSEYCENIRMWCREHLDIDIPLPGEQGEMFTHKHKS